MEASFMLSLAISGSFPLPAQNSPFGEGAISFCSHPFASCLPFSAGFALNRKAWNSAPAVTLAFSPSCGTSPF